jgi:hypothetical protein
MSVRKGCAFTLCFIINERKFLTGKQPRPPTRRLCLSENLSPIMETEREGSGERFLGLLDQKAEFGPRDPFSPAIDMDDHQIALVEARASVLSVSGPARGSSLVSPIVRSRNATSRSAGPS